MEPLSPPAMLQHNMLAAWQRYAYIRCMPTETAEPRRTRHQYRCRPQPANTAGENVHAARGSWREPAMVCVR